MYKVLIVTPVFPPNLAVGGGVAVTIGALTDKLIEKGCSVSVLSPRLDNVDYGTSSLYPAFPVEFPTLYNLRQYWRAIGECDILVCPDNTVMPFLVAFCRLLNKPLWFNIHTNIRHLLEMSGPFGYYVSAPICDSVLRLCSKMTSRTYTTSPSYRKVLLNRGYRVDGVFTPKIKLGVFMANDAEEEVAKARRWLVGGADLAGKTLLIYAGRFSQEKRIHLLAEMLPEDCVLAIVGDGPVHEVAALHNPARRVFVHRGMVDQPRLRVLYKACDFLVSASSFETLGMTVAEANVCGIPVIVQDATGFNTQVVPGKNGFLTNFEDKVAAQACIKRAIEMRPTREQINSVINSDTFWFAGLPNLEDEIVDLISVGGGGCSSYISPLIIAPCICVYYIVFWIIGFPFNTVNRLADRTRPGPVVFEPAKR
jgi:glycosyltransferase involved in cell wall biosynthesis